MIAGVVIHSREQGDGELDRVSRVDDALVTLEQAIARGMSVNQVREAVKSGHWMRVARAVYLVRSAGQSDPHTGIRANVVSLGQAAVAVYDSAASLHGIAGLRPSDAVHVSVPGAVARRRVDPKVVVHQLLLSDREVCQVAGIDVTTPLRTVTDLICRTGRYAAVSLVDSALNQRLLSPEELAAIPELIRGRRGAAAARKYLREVDGWAASPLETRMRLRCADGGVAPLDLQFIIEDENGDLLGVADAAWPWARVVAEADGRGPHSTPTAIFEDRQRQNRIVRAGWTVLRFTWEDTLVPEYIPATVRAALNRALPDPSRPALSSPRRSWR